MKYLFRVDLVLMAPRMLKQVATRAGEAEIWVGKFTDSSPSPCAI